MSRTKSVPGIALGRWCTLGQTHYPVLGDPHGRGRHVRRQRGTDWRRRPLDEVTGPCNTGRMPVVLHRFFGGAPKLLVPDNLKSGVNKASFYDREINRTYGARV
jgi:hypothetical protein